VRAPPPDSAGRASDGHEREISLLFRTKQHDQHQQHTSRKSQTALQVATCPSSKPDNWRIGCDQNRTEADKKKQKQTQPNTNGSNHCKHPTGEQ
jgi:hypothetical protein